MKKAWVTGIIAFCAALAFAVHADDEITFNVSDSAQHTDPKSGDLIDYAKIEKKLDKKEPSTLALLMEGAVLAIPQYFAGVATHEGSHALAVIVSGGKVTEFDILPKMFNGHVRFGETGWEGNFTKTQDTFIDMAPKMTDLAIMGTYSALLESGAYPDNKHLQLLLIVVDASAWVDFTKDLFTNYSDNDTVKAMANYGIVTPAQQLPYRLLWGGLALAGAVELGHGIYKLFKHSDADADKLYRKYGAPVIGPEYIGWQGTW